jgi:hypothetical protein
MGSIKEWQPYRFKVSIIREDKNAMSIKLIKEKKKEEKEKKEDYRPISGFFHLVKYMNTNMYIAITSEKQKFVKKALMRFFESYYSEASRLHINSTQIQQLLDSIKQKTNCDIITDRVVAYSRIDKRKKIILGRRQRLKESDLRWTEEDYQISFRKAAENDQWIHNINFYGQSNGKVAFEASISRDGLLKCNGNVKQLFDIVSGELLNVGKKNADIFSNKSRLENNGNIQPIAVVYPNDIFEDAEQNKKLIKAISEFPHSSYSVYHGNPYLHLSLVDYADGSSYDVWVVSSDKIIIVPQLRATFNSLSRFCEHVFKRFQEGRLTEFKVSQ